jgi:hypothetical protein
VETICLRQSSYIPKKVCLHCFNTLFTQFFPLFFRFFTLLFTLFFSAVAIPFSHCAQNKYNETPAKIRDLVHAVAVPSKEEEEEGEEVPEVSLVPKMANTHFTMELNVTQRNFYDTTRPLVAVSSFPP